MLEKQHMYQAHNQCMKWIHCDLHTSLVRMLFDWLFFQYNNDPLCILKLLVKNYLGCCASMNREEWNYNRSIRCPSCSIPMDNLGM